MSQSFLRSLSLALIVFALFSSAGPLYAADKTIPEIPESVQFTGDNPEITLKSLRGKTVIILFFQEWCPKCNAWSGQLFEQTTKAFKDRDDVVLVALKADSGSGESYLRDRKINLGHWVLGTDTGARYEKEVIGDDSLYKFVVIGPDGKLLATDYAGMKSQSPGQKPVYIMADPDYLKIPQGEKSTSIIPLDKEYPEAFAPVLLALKVKQPGKAFEITENLIDESKGDQKEEVESLLEQMEKGLLAETEQLGKTIEDEAASGRFEAYMELRNIEENVPKSDAGRAAKKILTVAKRDNAIKEELYAEKYWTRLQEKIEKDKQKPRKKWRYDAEKLKKEYGKIAEKYPETYYGKRASEKEQSL